MPCVFRVLSGPYRGKVFPLEASRPLLVGKALEADFTIPDGSLSPFHAKIEFSEGQTGRMARITALEPERTHIEVDGVPFDQALVRSGERFKIGETAMEFREGGRKDEPAIGTAAKPGTTCTACRRPVPRSGGGRVLLGVPYCVHCVDLRLTVRRDLGRYRVLRKIGRDSCEIIYLAEDLGLEPYERVALHVLKSERQHDPRVLRRFLTKAVFAYTLEHPVFPLTRDLSQRDSTVQYAEDLCEWPTIDDRLSGGGGESPTAGADVLPVSVSVKACMQLVDGLRFARKRGMIVGKLRSSKLHVSPTGAVRIPEYWLSPAVEEELAAGIGAPKVGDRSLVSVEPTAGDEGSSELKRYLAPDDKDVAHFQNEWMDVRPVGVVLFQLSTGAHPGDAPPHELAERLKKAFLRVRTTTSAPALPAIASKVVARTLDKNPKNRYRSMEELAKDLKGFFLAL